MKVALLGEKILIQKADIVTDRIGNRKNEWTDYFLCHATISEEGGGEKAVAGNTVDDSSIAFTVRYNRKTEVVTATEYRILFRGGIYDISSVDHMNYKKKCIKFRCRKVRR